MCFFILDTDDSGEKKPGKKGIMLNLEQWGAITQSLDNINKATE